MNRLSIRLGMVLLTMSLLVGSWTPRNTVKTAAHTKAFEYYFYSYPDYAYLGYNSTSGMESELASCYGYTVDEYPGGGTLIATGYLTPSFYQAPSVFLYVHMPLQP